MKGIINCRFLSQASTGVQVYARYLIGIGGSHAFNGFRGVAPSNSPIVRCAVGVERKGGVLRGHMWEQLVLPWLARDADVLFCPCNSAPIVSLLTKRTVVTVHCLSYKYVPEAFSLTYRVVYSVLTPLIMRFARRVITVSEVERENLVKLYPCVRERITVVPNGAITQLEAAELRSLRKQRARFGSSPTRILFVGKPSAKKNFVAFMNVCCALWDRGLDVVATVAGGAVEDGLAFANDARSTTAVRRMSFMGQIDDRKRLLNVYVESDVLLFPSVFESSGLPPTEAMAAGCAVVCSSIPALRERCGNAALYSDPHDHDGLLKHVYLLLTDEDVRNDMVHAGYLRAVMFSWERCCEATAEVVRNSAFE